ncbi:DsbA family oxidoreductase [Flavobacterium gilvum]|uniref:Disulfide bond formation protein DsbA n=1 Tax=Flavobacterium gilvum TaxID=1492737 RepID=A0AAC9I4Z7_9FLAO|nr:DsbA family oxidoreductase [Flavobacterium gilvum]AOW08973.1 disulfide bond formation protein DsbA [Flavobacterium gilvum]KFC57977.1 DSBA oxidoreductase [Flavobacterium gilvum]
MKNQLKVQIWSDVMCPFCYIGKRKIEEALSHFENKESVVIEWKSFQLDPNFVATPNENIVDHLAEKYRRDTDWAQSMIDNMTVNAKNSGLDFHFEKAILANSQNAHRLLHLAKKHQLSDEVKELLFKAYLTDGLNVNDWKTLQEIAQIVGLPLEEVNQLISSDNYLNEVRQDQQEAQALGVTGVPFFVFDNKYAISGAQPAETFLKALEQTWEEGEFITSIKTDVSSETNSCTIDSCK